MDNKDSTDYIVDAVLCDPEHPYMSAGAVGAQIVVCANKGWLSMHYNPGKRRADRSLTLTRECDSMPQNISLGEQAVLKALFGPGLTRNQQTLECFRHRKVAAACWKEVRSGMLATGLLERENKNAYQKKRLQRAGITALIFAALIGMSMYLPGAAKIAVIPFAAIDTLLFVYFLVRPKGWHVAQSSMIARDTVVARNKWVLQHHKEQPVSLLDALAANAPYFPNPPLHAPDAQRPSWFSSTPEVEAEVGRGFFMAVDMLLIAFCDRPGTGRDTAGSG